MMKRRNEQNQDWEQTTIAVTIHEASLIANMVYAATLNMHQLDNQQRQIAHQFTLKLLQATRQTFSKQLP